MLQRFLDPAVLAGLSGLDLVAMEAEVSMMTRMRMPILTLSQACRVTVAVFGPPSGRTLSGWSSRPYESGVRAPTLSADRKPA